jgi:hypothetical protein
MTGTLENRRKVIADGLGVSATLDLSSFSRVLTVIENTGHSRGWWAVGKGELLLPAVSVPIGQRVRRTWGDNEELPGADGRIDMVNSLEMVFENVTEAGEVSIALTAQDHAGVPYVPSDYTLVGIWKICPDLDLLYDAVDMTCRYDVVKALEGGLSQDDLLLLHHNGSGWERVDGWLSVPRSHIGASGLHLSPLLPFYAVGVPEPATLGLLALGGLALIRRRCTA